MTRTQSRASGRASWGRRLRVSALVLPLLLLLAEDLLAQRGGRGFSRGRSTSVRQHRSTSHSSTRRTTSASRDRDLDRARDRDLDRARDLDRDRDRDLDRARASTARSTSRTTVRSSSVRQSSSSHRVTTKSVHSTTVRTRRGDRLTDLPDRTQLYVHRKRYWYRHGRFYRKVYVSNVMYYEDVEGPVDAMVNEIPDDCEAVDIDGLVYHDCTDIWFLEVTEDDGRIRYKVVDPPQ